MKSTMTDTDRLDLLQTRANITIWEEANQWKIWLNVGDVDIIMKPTLREALDELARALKGNQ